MTALAASLLDLAVRIGRAIVRNLARWAVKRVVTWMRKRVRDFKRKWNAARIEGDAWRERWNLGRIQRWTKAADWVEARALQTLGEAARKVCKLPAFRKLPEVASCEKLTRAA